MREIYFLRSKVYASEVDKGGAYIISPYNIRKEFDTGRIRVQATFDNVSYGGNIMNTGMKDPDGPVCYILGLRGDIRKSISKEIGDIVAVTVKQK